MRIIDVNSKINDEWFKINSFKTFKKPSKEQYEIAIKQGITNTLEGPVKYDAGHYIITGPQGEKYPISPEKFKALKNDLGNGICIPKKIMKIAKLADHDGVIHTPWGDLNYTAGNDYIVRHGPNDYGVVKKDIFMQTYDTTNINPTS